MKYKLETIPVWDTYNTDCECPLCVLGDKGEQKAIDFYLGSSVMNPETRVKVNENGFCPEHLSELFKRNKQHSLGLLMHTYLEKRNSENLKRWQKLGIQAEKESKKKGLAGKGAVKKAALIETERQRVQNRKCLICEKKEYTIKRYAFSIVYMWKKEPEFPATLETSRGFCLEHFPYMLEMADEILSGKEYHAFVSLLYSLMQKNMKRLEEEILWFTQKFDQQNDDKSWGTSKDALERLVRKLDGKNPRS